MKKIILTLILFHGLIFSISAATVSVETAKLAGQNFLASHGAPDKILDLVFTKSDGSQTLYHIFNYDHGFVIVSADDRSIPVLGYSTEGPWVVPTDTVTGNNVMGWMRQYEEQIKSEVRSARSGVRSPKPEVRSPKSEVAPLLTTTWNQTWPYNEMCPGGNTMVGCVGVAMAQIMKYWEYPEHGMGSYYYSQGGYGTIGANFGGTTYNWANMPNSISSYNPDVATLCFHAAVSVGAIFGTGSTGVYYSTSAPPMWLAFWNNFLYAFDGLRYIESQSFTPAQWDSILQAELVAGRPVYYRGDGSVSHAWVCDGLDASNMYHFNFGWGGTYNGYYALSAITPGPYNISDNQHAIIGIQPNTDGSTITTNTTLSGIINKNTSIGVPDSLTLTFAPGLTLKMAGNKNIRVMGRLLSLGDSLHPVKVTAKDTNQRWGGMQWDNRVAKMHPDSSKLIWTQVEYSGNSGIFCYSYGNVSVSHCRINNNTGGTGAGLSVWMNPITIKNSKIYNNHSATQGGGFFITTTGNVFGEISGNEIHHNVTDASGGGFFLMNVGNILMKNNYIHHNHAPVGSGGAVMYGSPKIMNNVISGNSPAGWGYAAGLSLNGCASTMSLSDNLFKENTASSASALLVKNGSNCRILNNTFTNNIATNFSAITIADEYGTPTAPLFKNNVIWGNIPGNYLLGTANCQPVLDHNVVEGGLSGFVGPGASAYNSSNYTNNKDTIPGFVNATGGDYHLVPGSTLNNWGDTIGVSQYIPAYDLDGKSRYFGTIDLGAYELPCSIPAQPSSIIGNATPDQFSSQNYSVTNTPGVSYAWTFPEGWMQTDGGSTNSVTVIAGFNPGNITVTPFTSFCTGQESTLAVTPNALFVTPMTVGVPSTSGTKTFSVTASGTWSLSSDQPWCLVSGTSPGPGGNGTIDANYQENPSTTVSRTAHITVTSSTGVNPCVVTLTQAGSQYKALNIKVLLESLYFAGGLMRQAQDENGSHFGTGISDHATIELHDSADYSVIAYVADYVPLSIAGDLSVANIPASCTGRYRLTIKHRNSIETVSNWCLWGGNPGFDYDFTFSRWTCWGHNLKEISGKYVIYGGDVNQDGIVDSGDMNLIDNGSTTVMLGYYPEDVNGDGLVDSGDMNLTDNNNTAVIIAIVP